MEAPDFATPQPDSAEFKVVCAELNAARIDARATRGFDMLAGGFKYSDEVPRDIYNHPHLLAIVGVLRQLWGYRSFLIRGKIHRDLERVWTAAKTLAPHWAGFDPRCSREMAGELELALEESHQRIDEIVNLRHRA